MDRIEKQLRMFPGESIIAEAFFAPGKLQRQEIDELAHMYRFDVWYIWCHAPRYVCMDRVDEDYRCGRDDWERFNARMNSLQELHDGYFTEQEGEYEPYLLDRTCAHCRDRPYQPPLCQHCDDVTAAPICRQCAAATGDCFNCPACRKREARRRRRWRRNGGGGGGGGGGYYYSEDGSGSGSYDDDGYGGHYGGGGGSGYSTDSNSDYSY
ncbi:hypothetical protein CHLRE_11g467793v5 [Chlamydomonas reinhardtii]|uniref:Uncharacterized protein n=1 Tax=Chlamydomonas reinhardtii TaxID=3055 RepID=A0A2K3D814_CHLRE|nr:uncharacterized protein CHLRE_11g467793v5 [Chlamydomonas reinhardtii]PNW76674.1 hypothetical protein CHLRE_11g467793v5 [Chlamydomonas reinhardtii]